MVFWQVAGTKPGSFLHSRQCHDITNSLSGNFWWKFSIFISIVHVGAVTLLEELKCVMKQWHTLSTSCTFQFTFLYTDRQTKEHCFLQYRDLLSNFNEMSPSHRNIVSLSPSAQPCSAVLRLKAYWSQTHAIPQIKSLGTLIMVTYSVFSWSQMHISAGCSFSGRFLWIFLLVTARLLLKEVDQEIDISSGAGSLY